MNAWSFLNRESVGAAEPREPLAFSPLPDNAPRPATVDAAPSVTPVVALDPEVAIPLFVSDSLPQVEKFTELIERLLTPSGEDCAFRHAPDTSLDLAPGGMQVGRNLFGPGDINPIYRGSRGTMRGAVSVALHRAVASGRANSVQSVARGFFEPTVSDLMRDGRLVGLARLEPFYSLGDDGHARVARARPPIEFRNETAVLINGTGFPNYGHFLYDGLPMALMSHRLAPHSGIRLVGPRLAEWQRQLVQGLGLLANYTELSDPVCYERVLTSSLMTLHVAYPSRFVRPVFDTLRFLMGNGHSVRKRTVFLSRRADTTRRVLTNREEVERALIAEGVEIVQPERLSVAEQIALMSNSRFVIGEGGAAMANVGFCDPGTAVLEIQHEHGPDGWTRGACAMMGLRWHLYAARGDEAAMNAHPPPKPHAMLSIEVASLIEAVRAIKSSL